MSRLNDFAYVGQDIVCRCQTLRWLWATILIVVGVPLACIAQCALALIGVIAVAVRRRYEKRYTYEELNRRSVN